jgi:hypothetical protein
MAVHHANAIAQDRAAGKWARRVDRNHRHAAAPRSDEIKERGHQRALAGSGWSRHTDYVSPTGQWKERIQRLKSVWITVFD